MDWKILFNQLMKQSENKYLPIATTFELTPLCNFSCKMCYIKIDEKQMTSIGSLIELDQWIELGKQCKELGVLYMTLTGGEVFTYPGFKYFLNP